MKKIKIKKVISIVATLLISTSTIAGNTQSKLWGVEKVGLRSVKDKLYYETHQNTRSECVDFMDMVERYHVTESKNYYSRWYANTLIGQDYNFVFGKKGKYNKKEMKRNRRVITNTYNEENENQRAKSRSGFVGEVLPSHRC